MISKSGQSSTKPPPCSSAIDLRLSHGPALAIMMDFADYEAEGVQHQHPQGQLIFALHGAVTCKAESVVWVVPPHCGVWIPGGVPHSSEVTPNARITYLFVEPTGSRRSGVRIHNGLYHHVQKGAWDHAIALLCRSAFERRGRVTRCPSDVRRRQSQVNLVRKAGGRQPTGTWQ